MGDTGTISGEGFRIEVTDTQKKGDGLFVHEGKVVKGAVKTGAAVELTVDHARRTRLRSNHSATHLVHEALREVLGTHVAQKGSLVAPERLRFDFSHPEADLRRRTREGREAGQRDRGAEQPGDDPADVGRRRHRRRRDGAVRREIRRRGARRLDGHGDSGDKSGKPYSVELCGGTHVNATGDIGIVRLVGENAVSAGVRRIEALTGEAARRHLDEQDRRLKAVASTLKVAPADVPARVEALLDERRKLERELTEAKKKLALGGGTSASAGNEAETVAGAGFIGRTVSGVSPKDLKPLADEGKKSLGSGVVVFVGAGDDGKASVVVAVTDDLTKRFSAVDLVRAASAALGGQGGGGRPDMAQAGGPDATKAPRRSLRSRPRCWRREHCVS